MGYSRPVYSIQTTELFATGSDIVILLAGGAKSSQASDIRTALRLARHLEA